MNDIINELLKIIITSGVVGGILGFFLNKRLNAINSYNTNITAERIRWITRLKGLVSEYLSIIGDFHINIEDVSETKNNYNKNKDTFRKMQEIKYKIGFELFPKEKLHKDILQLMEVTSQYYRIISIDSKDLSSAKSVLNAFEEFGIYLKDESGLEEEFKDINEELLNYEFFISKLLQLFQLLFKNEWERVKTEIGNINSKISAKDTIKINIEYQNETYKCISNFINVSQKVGIYEFKSKLIEDYDNNK